MTLTRACVTPDFQAPRRISWPRSVSLLTLVTAGLFGCESKQPAPGRTLAESRAGASHGAASAAASPSSAGSLSAAGSPSGARGATQASADSSETSAAPEESPSAAASETSAAASRTRAASEAALQRCYPKAQVLLQLPPTWWLDHGAHIEGGRSRDLSFTADATGQVLWLMNESTQRLREYRAGKLTRELGPVPDGVVDVAHLGAERFALLYTDPAQVVVYDASTNQQSVLPAPKVAAEAFLQRTDAGVQLATFEDVTPLLTLSGQARRGAPSPQKWNTKIFHSRELKLTTGSSSHPEAEIRLDLGPGQWVRRGLVLPSPQRGFLALGRAETATRDTGVQYEDVFLLALDGVNSAAAPLRLVALAPSEFGPPLRRPLLATEERLLQLTSDSRGTSVLGWPWPKAEESCEPRQQNTAAVHSAQSPVLAGALKDEAQAGCTVRWDQDWLTLRCASSPAHPHLGALTLDEPFSHDYQSRVVSGSEIRTETNGLVGSSTRASSTNGADFVELGVSFKRGSRVSGNIEGKQPLRFELEWPQSAATLPQQLGRLTVKHRKPVPSGDY